MHCYRNADRHILNEWWKVTLLACRHGEYANKLQSSLATLHFCIC